MTKLSRKDIDTIRSSVHCEFKDTVYFIYVLEEVLLMLCVLYDRRIIDKSFQSFGGLFEVLCAFSLMNSMYKLTTVGLAGDPMAVSSTSS